MATTTKNFESAKQMVVIRPRTVNQVAFVYRDFSDLKNLIKFVGSKPSIDEEGKLWFGKLPIPDNCVVLRNSYGKVTEVHDFKAAEMYYEIAADSEFKPEHANKVEPKPVKEGHKENGISRSAMKEALRKASIGFKSGLTKDELSAIYNEAIKAGKIK
ncbi:MAG: hypothetical protein GYA62_05240 [Bacteroidales bacterium]|nr:hypothetical protein [Bacteroidales bacterium]